MQSPPEEDYSVKEISPLLGARGVHGDKLASTYDLVEQMQFIYVRVLKAKDLPTNDLSGYCDPFVELKLGKYKGATRFFEKETNPEWNEVFAFSRDRIQASILEARVKDKDIIRDDFLGRVVLDLYEIPKRFPPDTSFAPQWFRLEDWNGNTVRGELMLAVWVGTQTDEAFPEAFRSDAVAAAHADFLNGRLLSNTRSKVYLSPKLWYVRVNVIEALDLQSSDKTRYPEAFVEVILGDQTLSTKVSQSKSTSPMWDKDLMFVAAEPFEESLVLSVGDRVGPNEDEILGNVVIPLAMVDRRFDGRAVDARWYNLEKHGVAEGDGRKSRFKAKIHLRICLDGGYHVLDESSDLRPTAKQLWKPNIGILELGILSATGLAPMQMREGRESIDAYCVAKYGQKWVRTRTIIDSLMPKWNEQYAWEVFDPCTVITVGVFHNCNLQGERDAGFRDSKIGKVRIRLSTLQTGRVYTHSYPLLVLHPSGVKKMGELQLAVRFTCSMLKMLHIYSQPLFPKMHHLHPISANKLDRLRYQATQIISTRLSRAEPPLRKEVVEYILDVDSGAWSMRRSIVNLFRLMEVLTGLIVVGKWFDQICNWKHPLITILVHFFYIMLILYPKLILPMISLCSFLIGIWQLRGRPRHPSHTDIRFLRIDDVIPDELDEEFDTFPSSRPSETVRIRYDRLRTMAGRIQMVVGDMASQGERFLSLFSWRDPRATALFVTLSFISTIVLYVTPFQVMALLAGFYVLRHPWFRHKMPSVPLNLFQRLPAKTESML